MGHERGQPGEDAAADSLINKSAPRDDLAERVIRVDSLDDPRLDGYRNLRDSPQGRRLPGQPFVVEGRWVVERLLQSQHAVRSVVVQIGREAGILEQADSSINVFSLSREQIRELAGFDFHRGFLACADRPAVLGIDQLLPNALSLGILEITDMENLGSMMRSAAAFGIEQILIDDASVDPFSRRGIRVSMGGIATFTFGKNDNAIDGTQWIVSRSLGLIGTAFIEIYRFTGAIDIASPGILFEKDLQSIAITDTTLTEGVSAFYRFETELQGQ